VAASGTSSEDRRPSLATQARSGSFEPTGYNGSLDLGKGPMATEVLATPVEKFTISIVSADAHHGTLTMEWGPFRWVAPIVVR